MRILLLGANGQVGHELRRSLAPLGEVIATTRSGQLPDGSSCEVADFDQPASLATLVEHIQPQVVVNAAAYTAVDKAEDDADAAFRANAQAPGVLARACAAAGIRFIHYSTDYVFDGKATRPYREDDATHPVGVYGSSKLAGEQAIQSAGGNHQIFRTAWVYGSHGNNFMKTMLRLAADRDELRVVGDQTGTPTPAWLIADLTAAALALPEMPSGVFHLTASGSTTWHGFAQAIIDSAVEHGLLARAPAVIAIASADYPTRAERPACSCLDNTRLQQVSGIAFPSWQDGLGQVLAGLQRFA